MTRTYERSKKLANYLNKIRNETGHEIAIEWSKPGPGIPVSGVPGRFLYDPSCILILMNSDIARFLSDSEIEEVIAHEATHGFLIHKKGHCPHVLKHPASDIEEMYTSLLFSMVDDIVVNTILQEEGYSPLPNVYLYMVRKETISVRKEEDYYEEYSYDPLLKDRFMVFRYITAWGYLNYFDLKSHDRRTIKKFTKTFENKCPKQFEMASQVKKVILQNDILTVEGRNSAMRELLKLWNLEDLVELKTNERS